MELIISLVFCLLFIFLLVLFWFLLVGVLIQSVKSDEFQRLGMAIRKLELEMGKAIIPPLQKIADAMADFLERS